MTATTVVPGPAPAVAPEPVEAEATTRALLRVRADLIDKLSNEAGEVAIARARVEGELRSLKANLLELTSSVIRLRSQVREIEIQAESQIQSRMSAVQVAHEGFDPLEFDRYTRFQELTRSLAEGVNDVSTVQQSLLKNLDDADAALLAQARLSRDVQQRLFSIRTVPFSSLSERLYRILRATARELGKRANLEIVGAQTELDRSVLERLAGPLEHLLRNALDHGLESSDARRASGKSETGEITLSVRQVGNEIMIELADDGGGIDLKRVADRAKALGLFPDDVRPTDAQLIECIFRAGFSTASKVTQISGRGVGMDVVRAEIAALGGRVEAATRPGLGTTFTLYLPLTLAVAQAVLVRAGGRLWALPAPMVEQVQQIKAELLLQHYVAREVEWQGRRYPFHYLPRLLGENVHPTETARANPVLLLKSGQSHAAIHVDEMVGNQEVVVKNIGPQLARVSGIAGATVLGNGEIVLIINPVTLAQRADIVAFDPSTESRVPSAAAKAAAAASARPMVMVVDDSLTVRKITSRLLQREGFDVTTARDGMDALQVLGEHVPDVILLDIEMPRMDGFEFTRTAKADPRYAHIPIVMITSRTADKHRNRARGARRRPLPGQAVPGRGAAAPPARDAGDRRLTAARRRAHHALPRPPAAAARPRLRRRAVRRRGRAPGRPRRCARRGPGRPRHGRRARGGRARRDAGAALRARRPLDGRLRRVRDPAPRAATRRRGRVHVHVRAARHARGLGKSPPPDADGRAGLRRGRRFAAAEAAASVACRGPAAREDRARHGRPRRRRGLRAAGARDHRAPGQPAGPVRHPLSRPSCSPVATMR